jgi:hypothetical protein
MKEALNLLGSWQAIDLEEALPLLSGFFSVNNSYKNLREIQNLTDDIKKCFKEIRKLAVKALEKEPIEMIKLIILQLIQGLRYEDHTIL